MKQLTITCVGTALLVVVASNIGVAAGPEVLERPRRSSTPYELGGRGGLRFVMNSSVEMGVGSLSRADGTRVDEFTTDVVDGFVELSSATDGDVRVLVLDVRANDAGIMIPLGAGISVPFGGWRISLADGGFVVHALGGDLPNRPVLEGTLDSVVSENGGDQRVSISGAVRYSPSFAREMGLNVVSDRAIGRLELNLPVRPVLPRRDRSAIEAPVESPSESTTSQAQVGAIGPDVVVSGVGSSMREHGTVGNISAYSFDTTSCNRGDAQGIWIECFSGVNCKKHPVISQNLYRLRTVGSATQYEQIGMAWLKHGFCAADAGLCGACENAGTCDWLGINCSDTYSSFLNGRQQGMGPRSEVNPFTGDFPYPYTLHWQGIGDEVFKRLQVDQDDVNPALNAGAKYVAQTQYITTDEDRDRRFNNSSWREIFVGSFLGSLGWDLNFNVSFQTRESETPLDAWVEFDAGVTLVDAFVPDEGRYVLGYKTTQTAAELWHYEYVLYNMNSDRAARALSVPIPSGVGVSGVGFHDVDYHSSEPYALTDWVSSQAAGLLTWATDSMATDPNANALRWDTSYTFRFDSDRPPVAADVFVDLFKPGTPSALTISAVGPSPLPGGCECLSHSGCDDGNPCTADLCTDCVCSADDVIYGDVDNNGTINLFDLFCVIDAFAKDYEICTLEQADIEPCNGNGTINLQDLFAVLDAFSDLDPCCITP